MNITVLFGTETGNAEMLAEDVAAHLEGDHDVTCTNLCDFAPADFTPNHFYLVICSTYGDGELPSSAKPFAEAMAQARPDLDGIHFAIFGLGDTEYDATHNFGSKNPRRDAGRARRHPDRRAGDPRRLRSRHGGRSRHALG